MADNFHPTFRAREISIYFLGVYIGAALSSFTSLMISGIEWRSTLAIVGMVGIGTSILDFNFIREPERRFFEAKKPANAPKVDKPPPLTQFMNAAKEIFINPT
jgi:hypothetical protein